MTEQSVVDLQGLAFASLDELCSGLSEDQWAQPTECPGWSVQDNISHIIGTESMLLGRPAPDHEVEEKPWVRNPMGATNEVQVDYRRMWPPLEVLSEFREVTTERMEVLRAMSEEDLDAESWTPVGPGRVRDLIAIRIMDCWVHEQDIRRAVGRPGGVDGPVAEHALTRHSTAIPFVVGKKVGAPDGTTVVIAVEGREPFAVAVEGKRASLVPPPEAPTVTLSIDPATFSRLCCGRGDALDVGKGVRIEGDAVLGGQIVQNMNFMV